MRQQENLKREQALYPLPKGLVVRLNGGPVVKSTNGKALVATNANLAQLKVIDPVKRLKTRRNDRFSIQDTAIGLANNISMHGVTPFLTWTKYGMFARVPR